MGISGATPTKGEGAGRFMRALWPIHRSEWDKVLPLFFLKFLVSFNFVILHATKDTVVVMAPGSGAEVIPVLKGGPVLVLAFLAALLYARLSQRLSREQLFYATLTPFLVFFLLFGLLLYPLREHLALSQLSDWIVGKIGAEHGHWAAVVRYWMHAWFFAMCELWGGVVISLLFWGLANQVSSVSEAARFYAFYSIGGHLGSLLAGGMTAAISLGSRALAWPYEVTVCLLMLIVVAAGIAVMWLYHALTRHPSLHFSSAARAVKPVRSATSSSFWESVQQLRRSPYLGCIAILVIAYGLAVNLVEVSWKSTLKVAYRQESSFQAFLSMVDSATAVVSILMATLISGPLIRSRGWAVAASLTPVVLGILSLGFFLLYWNYQKAGGGLPFWYADLKYALLAVVYCGALHNVACKSMKYCLFDPTKEMAYIPLDEESKVKGKAAVDVVGARLGKSGSSWIQMALIDGIGAGSVLGVVPWFAPLVFVTVIGWLMAVQVLGKRLRLLAPQAFEPSSKREAGSLVSKVAV